MRSSSLYAPTMKTRIQMNQGYVICSVFLLQVPFLVSFCFQALTQQSLSDSASRSHRPPPVFNISEFSSVFSPSVCDQSPSLDEQVLLSGWAMFPIGTMLSGNYCWSGVLSPTRGHACLLLFCLLKTPGWKCNIRKDDSRFCTCFFHHGANKCSLLIRFRENLVFLHDCPNSTLSGLFVKTTSSFIQRTYLLPFLREHRFIITLFLRAIENDALQLSRCLPPASILSLLSKHMSAEIIKAGLSHSPFVSSLLYPFGKRQFDDVTVLRISDKSAHKKGKQTVLGTLLPYKRWQELNGGTGDVYCRQGELREGGNLELASHVVSVSLVNPEGLSSREADVNITFPHQINTTWIQRPLCVFWDTAIHRWSRQGCSLLATNASHTRCACHHLSTFGVLMNVKNFEAIEKSANLHFLGSLGTSVSSVCLLVTVFTFLYFKNLKSDRNHMHTHLAFSLMLANTLTIFSDFVGTFQYVCLVVTIQSHYFYLSAFAWMLNEGLQLFILFARPKDTSMTKTRWYMAYCMGYMIPFLITLLTFISHGRRRYMSPTCCWLDVKSGAIWSFVGPVIFVLVINTFVLSFSMYMMLVHSFSSKMAWRQGILRRLGVWLKGSSMLMSVLGLPWVFGILDVNKHTHFFSYIFVIINSLQGLSIFILYCLFNEKVCNEYLRFMQSIESSPQWFKNVVDSMVMSRAKRRSYTRKRSSRRRSLWKNKNVGGNEEVEKLRHDALEMIIAGWEPSSKEEEEAVDEESSSSDLNYEPPALTKMGLKFSTLAKIVVNMHKEVFSSEEGNDGRLSFPEETTTRQPSPINIGIRRFSFPVALQGQEELVDNSSSQELSRDSTEEEFPTCNVLQTLFRTQTEDHTTVTSKQPIHDPAHDLKNHHLQKHKEKSGQKRPFESMHKDELLKRIDSKTERKKLSRESSGTGKQLEATDHSETKLDSVTTQTSSDETALSLIAEESKTSDAAQISSESMTTRSKVDEDISYAQRNLSSLSRLAISVHKVAPSLMYVCHCCCREIRLEKEDPIQKGDARGKSFVNRVTIVPRKELGLTLPKLVKTDSEESRAPKAGVKVPQKSFDDGAVQPAQDKEAGISKALPPVFFVHDSFVDRVQSDTKTTQILTPSSMLYRQSIESPTDLVENLLPVNELIHEDTTTPAPGRQANLLHPTAFLSRRDDSVTEEWCKAAPQPGSSSGARPSFSATTSVLSDMLFRVDDSEDEVDADSGAVDGPPVRHWDTLSPNTESLLARARANSGQDSEDDNLVSLCARKAQHRLLRSRKKLQKYTTSSSPRSILKGDMELLDILADNRDPSIKINYRKRKHRVYQRGAEELGAEVDSVAGVEQNTDER